MQNIVRLTPILFEKVWGGQKLKSKLRSDLSNIGESWEVSTHPNGVSQFDSHLLSDHTDLNYLVKFIDTNENLSIQVHPDDEFAQKFENDNGKPECWFILDSEPGAGIYLGFKEGVTVKVLQETIEKNGDVQDLLNFIPVKYGMFIMLPPGAIHAIGKGVTLCEVQRRSDITYRVWDWNRVDNDGKGRELHLDKALQVLNFSTEFNESLIAKIDGDYLKNNKKYTLGENIRIDVLTKKESTQLEPSQALIDLTGYRSFFCITKDEFQIDYQSIYIKVSELK